jgi:hypothetical protein
VVATALVSAAPVRVWVALNGCPVCDGLLPLQHTDQLDIAASTFWISAESVPVRTRYMAADHGPQARCTLTKSRLADGQEIVICPGVAGTPCGRIYAAAAWETVIERNPLMKCMQCGYRPGQPSWCPPAPATRKDLIHGLRPFTDRH